VRLVLILIILLLTLTAEGQKAYQLHVFKAKNNLKIDGVLNEPDWIRAEQANQFYASYPFDTGYARSLTECRVTYDDKFLSVSAHFLNARSYQDRYIIQSLRRDYSFPVSDAFAVLIDPFKDRTNGFNFGVNPYNVQREGLVSNGGRFGTSTDWDIKWLSATSRDSSGWYVEMAIPFKSLRFKENEKSWYINFVRNDLVCNELSCWVPVPRQYNPNTLAFTGELKWDDAPRKPGVNISLIPYGIGTGTYLHNSIPDGLGGFRDTSFIKWNGGFDGKVAITSSLNLDLTVNPDFSQVEVDRQQTNLTRFNLFFPERRNFFLENSDLFASFGFSQIRPFFSRRIGLQDGNTIPIIGGARLSGKINNQWRIGSMVMQTAKTTINNKDIEAQNYAVTVLQRKVFSRSFVSCIMLNRQQYSDKEGFTPDNYNRIAGLQYNLSSKDNHWNGIFFYMHSFNPNQPANSYAHASYLNYQVMKWDINWNHEYVGENFIADIGFIPRLNNFDARTKQNIRQTFWRFEPNITRYFFPKSNTIRNFALTAYCSNYYDGNFTYTEQYYYTLATLNFLNTASVSFKKDFNFMNLPFDSFIGNAKDSIPIGKYAFDSYQFAMNTDTRKLLNLSAGTRVGSFYNGTINSLSASVSYRKQPWGVLAMSMNYDRVNFEGTRNDFELLLVGLRTDLTFTRNLFFTTFLQYNTQIENFNINTRLQWRFKPMSDLFIVYTDNYNTANFSAKNKALVLKLNYWFTL